MRESDLESLILAALHRLWPRLRDLQEQGTKLTKFELTKVLISILDHCDLTVDQRGFVVEAILDCVKTNGNADETRAAKELLGEIQ